MCGGEVYTGFWRGRLRKSDHLKDLGVDGMIKKNLQEVGLGTWTGVL
jgi:hypothetical protein